MSAVTWQLCWSNLVQKGLLCFAVGLSSSRILTLGIAQYFPQEWDTEQCFTGQVYLAGRSPLVGHCRS